MSSLNISTKVRDICSKVCMIWAFSQLYSLDLPFEFPWGCWNAFVCPFSSLFSMTMDPLQVK